MASLICVCGEEIGTIPGEVVETSELSEEYIAEIDEEIDVFVQKCSACGALNFSLATDQAVKICYNCHKARIATIKPVKYTCDEKENRENEPEESLLKAPQTINPKKDEMGANYVPVNSVTDDDDDDDDGDDASPWMNLLSGIEGVTGGSISEKNKKGVPQQHDTIPVLKSSTAVNDDDDDDDVGNWDGILGINAQAKTSVQSNAGKEKLTLYAVRYGQCSYTIKKTDVPLLIGRDAELKEFLSHDPRVSNEHCYIDYENNQWVVRDNESSNGTAVNSRDIGLCGKIAIHSGDLLKLGHHSDSMEFKVLIEE